MIKYIYKRCKRCDRFISKDKEEDYCSPCKREIDLEDKREIETRLKPCPFCGSSAKIDSLELQVIHYRIICSKCPVLTGVRYSVEEVLEIWNNRVIKGEENGKNISNI